jgi:uncharacterized protein (UPF0548 family)
VTDPAAGLNYGPTGIARPGEAAPADLRVRERSTILGEGDELWQRAVAAVSGWKIKKRVGFRVAPDDDPVVAGRDYDLRFGIGRLRLPEPARVVWVEATGDLRGFGYGTRPRHPITGEEAFLVERLPDGRVRMTVRSVSRVSDGRWRILAPAIRVAQPWFQRRYLAAARRLVTR